MTSARPNILIVMTDHQRGDTAQPDHPVHAPHLRRLASEGLNFSRTFCAAPHCCPSRATFFTGLYPSQHGIWNNVLNDMALSRSLQPGVRCWSQDLAEAGYQLGFAGKWHVSAVERPKDRGWREWFVSATSTDRHGPSWDSYRQRGAQMSSPTTHTRAEGQLLRPGYGSTTLFGRNDSPGPQEHDQRTLAAALDALPTLAQQGQPWGLYVGFVGPHDPYMVPGRFLDLYDPEKIPLPVSYTDDMHDKPAIYRRLRRDVFGQLSPREVRETIRHYWAYCSWLDEHLGKILAALDATGQAHNTLVLYCADHGDYVGEHGLFAKGIPCFRGAYHVPAVVRWPAGIASPGRTITPFVSLADFAPTFRELAGCSTNSAGPGASLLPFFQGTIPHSWRDDIHTQCNGVELYYTQRSVMTDRFKYVFNGFDEDELYDLATDPHEMTNLAARPEHRTTKLELCRRMWRFAATVNDPAINDYLTVALAPYGPGVAFESSSL